MYERPMSAGEIASELKANVNTVASALSRIEGLQRRDPSEAQKIAFQHGKKPTSYWTGKKQPDDMIERRVSKIRGDNHYLWAGGKTTRPYRRVIEKRSCSKCGARFNLCIHHVNFDHYDNREDNLQVLCVGCHLGLHKAEYWKAIREGRTPMKSTGESHWKKGGK